MAASSKRKRRVLKATVDSDSEEERDIDVGVSVNMAGDRVVHRHAHNSPRKQQRLRPQSPTPCTAEPLPAPDFAPEYNQQKHKKQVSCLHNSFFLPFD